MGAKGVNLGFRSDPEFALEVDECAAFENVDRSAYIRGAVEEKNRRIQEERIKALIPRMNQAHKSILADFNNIEGEGLA